MRSQAPVLQRASWATLLLLLGALTSGSRSLAEPLQAGAVEAGGAETPASGLDLEVDEGMGPISEGSTQQHARLQRTAPRKHQPAPRHLASLLATSAAAAATPAVYSLFRTQASIPRFTRSICPTGLRAPPRT